MPEETFSYDEFSCCETPYLVTIETRRRALKNIKKFRAKVHIIIMFMAEYKKARERVKYAPGGEGYKAAKDDFEQCLGKRCRL